MLIIVFLYDSIGTSVGSEHSFSGSRNMVIHIFFRKLCTSIGHKSTLSTRGTLVDSNRISEFEAEDKQKERGSEVEK